MTNHDIARRAGVSLGTVSNVLNSKVGVSASERERVQAASSKQQAASSKQRLAISELDYQPNHLSRALRTSRTNLIGMIIPDITNPFFPFVARGVEDVAFAHQYRLLLCNADNDVSKETAYLIDLVLFFRQALFSFPPSITNCRSRHLIQSSALNAHHQTGRATA